MSKISFFCPECGESLQFDLEQVGHEVCCPVCSTTFVIPVPNVAQAIELPTTTKNNSNEGHALPSAGTTILTRGKKQAESVLADFKTIDFKDEIFPIDATNIQVVFKDFVFWAVTLLGVVPLFIVTIRDTQVQLTMFALFFAFVWGVIFKFFVLKDQGAWKWPLASLFFTGIIGLALLLAIYKYVLPDSYLLLARSKNPIISLIGYVLQVGICEEVTKALPILVLAIWKRKSFNPRLLVIVGIFSGLGFAAFENLQYGVRAVLSSYELTTTYGVEGLVTGVQNAMITAMLRSISMVFCHAVFSGIVGYFIAIALLRKQKIAALIILGFCVASVLHGVYDWFSGMQPTIAALIAGLCFMLFYGYLSKLTVAIKQQEQTDGEGLGSANAPPQSVFGLQ